MAATAFEPHGFVVSKSVIQTGLEWFPALFSGLFFSISLSPPLKARAFYEASPPVEL
ncbi:MAG: hypothetical protein ACLRVT_09210 [Oscillospiraceae bacterium]